MIKKLFILTFILSCLMPAQGKLLPIDEAGNDSSLVNFRNNLLEAASKKDLNFILNSLEKNILNSFGGDGGVDEFKQVWDVTNPESSLWDEMNTILSMGGSFIEDDTSSIFAAPYIYSEWPEELDLYDYMAVTDSGVILRSKPAADAPEKGVLSYSIVKPDFFWEGSEDWFKVTTTSGTEGFLERQKLRSPLDYRIGIQKKNGQWKIVWFVSGD